MNRQKEICYCNQKVGTAKICTEGLYYRFECRCTFHDAGIYRLYAMCNEKKAYLGICVPVGNEFGITTKIPVKRLGTGGITVVAESEEKADVIAVDKDKPFRDIERLDNAVLCGEGIRFKE